MTATRLFDFPWYRRGAYAWRHGRLPSYAAAAAGALLVLVFGVSAVQAWRSRAATERLSARSAALEARGAASAAARAPREPADFVPPLRAPPTVADVMQTMQRAADAENARVVSLQAEEPPATADALGRLDLLLSIKGAYPSI